MGGRTGAAPVHPRSQRGALLLSYRPHIGTAEGIRTPTPALRRRVRFRLRHSGNSIADCRLSNLQSAICNGFGTPGAARTRTAPGLGRPPLPNWATGALARAPGLEPGFHLRTAALFPLSYTALAAGIRFERTPLAVNSRLPYQLGDPAMFGLGGWARTSDRRVPNAECSQLHHT